MEGLYCNGALAHASIASRASSNGPRGRDGPLPVAGVQRVHCRVNCARLLTAVLGRAAAASREWRGSRMCVPAQINTSAPTRVVPASAGAAKQSSQTRCVVVVVLLFGPILAHAAVQSIKPLHSTSNSFASTQENDACRWDFARRQSGWC
jgi:hypothetical protein